MTLKKDISLLNSQNNHLYNEFISTSTRRDVDILNESYQDFLIDENVSISMFRNKGKWTYLPIYLY